MILNGFNIILGYIIKLLKFSPCGQDSNLRGVE